MCYLFQSENFATFKSPQMGAANPGSNNASSALSPGCHSLIPSTPWALISCHCHPALEVRGQMVLSSSDCHSVQLLSHVWLFETSWIAAHQASLSITNSRSLLKLMSIESLMPSNNLILVIPFSSCLQSFPASGSFPMNQLFTSDGQSIGASPSASVLPVSIQGWFPLEFTGLISLEFKRPSRVFSDTTSILQPSAFFVIQLSHLYMTTGKTIALTI